MVLLSKNWRRLVLRLGAFPNGKSAARSAAGLTRSRDGIGIYRITDDRWSENLCQRTVMRYNMYNCAIQRAEDDNARARINTAWVAGARSEARRGARRLQSAPGTVGSGQRGAGAALENEELVDAGGGYVGGR